MKTIGKAYLSADVNRTQEPYLGIVRSGGKDSAPRISTPIPFRDLLISIADNVVMQ